MADRDGRGDRLARPARVVRASTRDLFAADVLIGSDGPRLGSTARPSSSAPAAPYPIDLRIDAREGGHHSGNWGGLLSNPAIQLAHALADHRRPDRPDPHSRMGAGPIPDTVRRALADCEVEAGPGAPAIDPNWGEPGSRGAEKVFGWCTSRSSR